MYQSIPNENAAKPPAPNAMACGPAFAASNPPVKAPAATLLYKSFFALYYPLSMSVLVDKIRI